MSYVAVVFVVGLLIAIHEYGHLLAAKLCGILVKRFSIGFGPKVLEVKHGETSYGLSWVPIGGYVLPAIEQDDFRELPAYQRITFALGGPMANVIAAFMGLFLLGLTELGFRRWLLMSSNSPGSSESLLLEVPSSDPRSPAC